MKITRAYIDEPKPKECRVCELCLPNYEQAYSEDDYACLAGSEDYSHCPLVYAPSRSVMRRLDIQMDDKGEE